MSILEQSPGLLEALRGEMTPKFLATCSAAGVPNVVPVVSILPADDQPDTLFFGNFLLRKSIRNLQEEARVGILVVTPELRGWILRGDFVEFQRTGPYVERQMNSTLLRYNAYTGIRNAGIIRVRALLGEFRIPRLQVALDYVRARAAILRQPERPDGGIVIPRPVRQEFARMVAVKVLAWIGTEGYPTVVPALSLQPAGERSLAGRLVHDIGRLGAPSAGAGLAANILTFAAISYQVKGKCRQSGRTCVLQAEEVYAGGPPLPGGRVA